MTTDMERVARLMESKDYAQALSLVDAIIQRDPSSLSAYLQKSVISRRLNQFRESLDASERAVILSDRPGKNIELGQAQLNRAISLYHLGRFGDADFAIQLSKKSSGSIPSLEIWEAKLASKLDEASEEEAAINISRIPVIEGFPVTQDKSSSIATETNTISAKPAAPAVNTEVRFDYYQSAELTNVSLFIKNVPKDTAVVSFSPTSVSLVYIDSTGTQHEHTYGPLYDAIIPEQSSYRIFGTKVELYLKKSRARINWNSLLADGTGPDAAQINREKFNQLKTAFTGSDQSSETSSRKVKDWDKINFSDDEDDRIGADSDPNQLFQSIYKDADDDTKRAMMKSYVESNGTALSTNWSDVSKKKYEIDPPSEMEVKKW